MTPSRFRWGLILIFAGLILFLQNLDQINSSALLNILAYFPLILIAIGIEKIFTGSRLEFVAYLPMLLLLGWASFIAIDLDNKERGSDFFSRLEVYEEMDQSVRQLSVDLDIGYASLLVRDATEDLYYVEFGKYMEKPSPEYRIEDGRALVDIKHKQGKGLSRFVHIDNDEDNEWEMKFSQELPLYLTCEGFEADIHLNMTTVPLRKLDLVSDESMIYVKIGDLLPIVDLDITGDYSSLRLRFPENSGIKIKGDEYSGLFEQLGFKKGANGDYYSADFENSQNQIFIRINENIEDLSIDLY